VPETSKKTDVNELRCQRVNGRQPRQSFIQRQDIVVGHFASHIDVIEIYLSMLATVFFSGSFDVRFRREFVALLLLPPERSARDCSNVEPSPHRPT
jgi:hypothetical protein